MKNPTRELLSFRGQPAWWCKESCTSFSPARSPTILPYLLQRNREEGHCSATSLSSVKGLDVTKQSLCIRVVGVVSQFPSGPQHFNACSMQQVPHFGLNTCRHSACVLLRTSGSNLAPSCMIAKICFDGSFTLVHLIAETWNTFGSLVDEVTRIVKLRFDQVRTTAMK